MNLRNWIEHMEKKRSNMKEKNFTKAYDYDYLQFLTQLDPELLLGELLATIHNDGGQYTSNMGLVQSVYDAIKSLNKTSSKSKDKLLLELVFRNRLAFPRTSWEKQMFEEGLDHKVSGDFMLRLFDAIDLENEQE